MTRPTSLQAFRDLALPEAQAKALLALRLHGPCTSLELEHAADLRHVSKRLPELRNVGAVHESGRRVCKVSGKQAILWSVGPGDGVRRREVPSIAPNRDNFDAAFAAMVEAWKEGRTVVSVTDETIGGVVCRVTTTHRRD